MAISPTLLSRIEDLAKARNDPKVPRKFIVEAVKRILAGEEPQVRMHGMGVPSYKDAYIVARRLFDESTPRPPT